MRHKRYLLLLIGVARWPRSRSPARRPRRAVTSSVRRPARTLEPRSRATAKSPVSAARRSRSGSRRKHCDCRVHQPGRKCCAWAGHGRERVRKLWPAGDAEERPVPVQPDVGRPRAAASNPDMSQQKVDAERRRCDVRGRNSDPSGERDRIRHDHGARLVVTQGEGLSGSKGKAPPRRGFPFPRYGPPLTGPGRADPFEVVRAGSCPNVCFEGQRLGSPFEFVEQFDAALLVARATSVSPEEELELER